MSPSRSPDNLYPALVVALLVSSVGHSWAANFGDVLVGTSLFDASAPTAGTLTLYQLDCACSDVIKLWRDRMADRLVLEF